MTSLCNWKKSLWFFLILKSCLVNCSGFFQCVTEPQSPRAKKDVPFDCKTMSRRCSRAEICSRLHHQSFSRSHRWKTDPLWCFSCKTACKKTKKKKFISFYCRVKINRDQEGDSLIHAGPGVVRSPLRGRSERQRKRREEELVREGGIAWTSGGKEGGQTNEGATPKNEMGGVGVEEDRSGSPTLDGGGFHCKQTTNTRLVFGLNNITTGNH